MSKGERQAANLVTLFASGYGLGELERACKKDQDKRDEYLALCKENEVEPDLRVQAQDLACSAIIKSAEAVRFVTNKVTDTITKAAGGGRD